MFRRSARIRSPVQPVKYVCAELGDQVRERRRRRNSATITVERVQVAAGGSRRRARASRGTAAASAVSVAARSEPIASAVRRLYGAASRASVEIRRAVRRHDQSSTLAPRCIGQVRPGLPDPHARRPRGVACTCRETHLPDPMARAYRRKRARGAGSCRKGADSGPDRVTPCVRPGLHPLGELALEQPVLVDLAVDAGCAPAARRASRARRCGRGRARRARRRARSSRAGGR